MNNKGKLWNGSKKQAKIRISLYGRQNIIQIGKDVVRVLGVPPYISIRINPEMDSTTRQRWPFRIPAPDTGRAIHGRVKRRTALW